MFPKTFFSNILFCLATFFENFDLFSNIFEIFLFCLATFFKYFCFYSSLKKLMVTFCVLWKKFPKMLLIQNFFKNVVFMDFSQCIITSLKQHVLFSYARTSISLKISQRTCSRNSLSRTRSFSNEQKPNFYLLDFRE